MYTWKWEWFATGGSTGDRVPGQKWNCDIINTAMYWLICYVANVKYIIAGQTQQVCDIVESVTLLNLHAIPIVIKPCILVHPCPNIMGYLVSLQSVPAAECWLSTHSTGLCLTAPCSAYRTPLTRKLPYWQLWEWLPSLTTERCVFVHVLPKNFGWNVIL